MKFERIIGGASSNACVEVKARKRSKNAGEGYDLVLTMGSRCDTDVLTTIEFVYVDRKFCHAIADAFNKAGNEIGD